MINIKVFQVTNEWQRITVVHRIIHRKCDNKNKSKLAERFKEQLGETYKFDVYQFICISFQNSLGSISTNYVILSVYYKINDILLTNYNKLLYTNYNYSSIITTIVSYCLQYYWEKLQSELLFCLKVICR